MPRYPIVLLLTMSLTLPALALAEGLTAEQIARIRRDEKAAIEKVNAAHGNKKPSELSNAERKQMIEEQQQALQGVMEKHGASRKDYARQVARMGPKGNAEVEAAEEALEAAEKAAQASKSEGSEGITVQKGFSNENPVEMESAKGAPPAVEQGLPVEGS